MKIRTASTNDATAMSEMLLDLVSAGKRTAGADIEFVLEHYVANPVGIRCTLAEDDRGKLLGFQSLIHSTEGNPYGTPVGWGIIGTHVSPNAARTGVGTALFDASREAAIEAGLVNIEAFIGKGNTVAQAYYERMGFETYRHTDTAVCKVCKLPRR